MDHEPDGPVRVARAAGAVRLAGREARDTPAQGHAAVALAMARPEAPARLRRPTRLLDPPRRRRIFPRAGRPARPVRPVRCGWPIGSPRIGRSSILEVGCGYGKQLRALARSPRLPDRRRRFQPEPGGHGPRIPARRGRGVRGPGLGRSPAVRRRVVRPGPDLGRDPPQPARGGRGDPPRGRPRVARDWRRTTRTRTSPTTASATTPPPGTPSGASRLLESGPMPEEAGSRVVAVLRGRGPAVLRLRRGAGATA